MSSPISCEYKDKIAVITIDKDHKLNALNQDEYYEIARYMREIATHDEVFITVLTGKGASIPLVLKPFLIPYRTILLGVSHS
jgi:Delta3-Delta2-enoyl-CoA isomerase